MRTNFRICIIAALLCIAYTIHPLIQQAFN